MGRVATTWKVILVSLALADLFGLLPTSLDVLDKGIAAVLLFLFWLELQPMKFMFGKKDKIMSVFLLSIFYIYMLDSFVAILRDIDPLDPVVQLISGPILSIPVLGQLLSYLYSPVNQVSISLFSAYVPFIALIIVSMWFAHTIKIKEKSVAHCIALLFTKEENLEDMMHRKEAWFVMSRFFLFMIVLFSMANYFFLLVNQWFIVSLDNSLIFLAVIYAVKDIRKTKSELVHKVVDFGGNLLEVVRSIFTTPKKFYLGFSVLLIAHYVSDLSNFFFAYFSIRPIEIYYERFLVEASHESLVFLFRSEGVSGINAVYGFISYFFSALGQTVLIAVPILLLYMMLAKIEIVDLVKSWWFKVIFGVCFVSVQVFYFVPWTYQVAIHHPGAQGVDFITQGLSVHGISFEIITIGILIGLVLMLFLKYRLLFNLLMGFLYAQCMIYLGVYVWNYFSSSFFYHTSLFSYFYETHLFLSVIFGFLLILDALFYFGGFLLFSFHITRALAKPVFSDIFDIRSISLLTIVLLAIPAVKLFEYNLESIVSTAIIIAVLIIGAFALYTVFRNEKRDDYLLGVLIAIGAYQFITLFSLFLSWYGWPTAVITTLQPAVVLLISLFLIRFFEIKILYEYSWHILLVGLGGLLFGLWFGLLGESIPSLFSSHWLIIVLFAIGVAVTEEYLFRGMLFSLAKDAFTFVTALILQAVVFAGVHFVNISELYVQFSSNWGILFLYFISLFGFGVVAGLIIKKNNLLPAIVLHVLANIVVAVIPLL